MCTIVHHVTLRPLIGYMNAVVPQEERMHSSSLWLKCTAPLTHLVPEVAAPHIHNRLHHGPAAGLLLRQVHMYDGEGEGQGQGQVRCWCYNPWLCLLVASCSNCSVAPAWLVPS